MKKKNGFTMAETLLTLAIIGVVAAIVLPALKNTMPNNEMAMFKKAYYNTSRLVSELINDEDFYPDRETPEESGFSNVTIADQTGGDEATFHGRTYFGPEKFCGLFGAKINTINEPNCGARVNLDGNGNFRTPDGVVWSMPVSDWGNDTEDIYVDVNGINKRPNCTRDDIPGIVNCPRGTGPDRFRIIVHRDGRLELVSEIARQYVSSTHVNWPYQEYVRRGFVAE